MPVANAIIAGVNKSGSTSLFQYMSSHADVCAASRKETCFFLPAAESGNGLEDVHVYEKYFRHYSGEKIILEATPGYFYGSTNIARAIKNYCGSPKIIIVLREPVSRTKSYFRFMQSMLAIPREQTLLEYVEKAEDRADFNLTEREPYAGVHRSKYSIFLDGWTEEFEGNLYIDFHENLLQNKIEFLYRICDFLGINYLDERSVNIPNQNKTQSFSNNHLHRIALKFNAIAGDALRKYPYAKDLLRNIYYKINGERAVAVKDETVVVAEARLRDIFLPYNKELASKLKGRPNVGPLPMWVGDH